jgi:bifunctional UDP-N-acetylglucosamine pyrophosphorylase / glucosamine-1-phosphate N-acetyltransferase
MQLTAIILAAGKSTRMHSRRAKPLHEICGKPMLAWVLEACYGAGCQRVIVVVGHGKDEVIRQFGDDRRIEWVEQTQMLGTGHAAQMCVPALKQFAGDVFVLAGDGPLIRSAVLQQLHDAHVAGDADTSMATAVLDDPTGYGRVIRDQAGAFIEIIEQIDATPTQRAVREVFPSYYCVKSDALVLALGQLKNDNKKGEYYLTDIYAILRRAGKKIVALQAVGADDVLAVNNRNEQAAVDAIMQRRIQSQLRSSGVSIASASNTYIEADVTIGAETAIHPFVHIGRSARIGSDCVIGPFAAIPAGAIIPDGTKVHGQPLGAATVFEDFAVGE